MPIERLNPPDVFDWATPVKMSLGLKAGNLIFVSGQVALEDGRVIGEGDIEAQTRVVFENITRVLREAGADMRHVVKLNTFYVYDGDDANVFEYYSKMAKARHEFIQEPGPAGTAIRMNGLSVPGLLIEVDAIAVLPT